MIAEELHDTVVQAIAGSTMVVENAAEKIPDSLPVVKGTLLRAVDKLEAALADSRAALKGLRAAGSNENDLARQLSDTANATPSEAASAMTSPGRDIRCHVAPPSVVAHSAGPSSQPSLAFSNRTVLTADAGEVVYGGTSETAGAGTRVQVLPPSTVFSSSARHGSVLQPRAPSTNPVCADTKLAESASNPFGGGGFPLAGCAEALPAPSASSSTGKPASTATRRNDIFIAAYRLTSQCRAAGLRRA